MGLAMDQAEVDYGVKTQNHYALLNDDDEDLDPFALVAAAQKQRKEDQAKAAAAKKADRKARLKEAARPAQPPPDARPPPNLVTAPVDSGRGRGRGRGGPMRGPGRSGLPPRMEAQPPAINDFAEEKMDTAAPAEKEGSGAGFGGGFGGSRGMGGGGGGGGEARPVRGRQFDRRSGSEQGGPRGGATEKRGGFGKGNWGTAEDELKGETEPLNETGSDGEAKVPPTEEEKAPEPPKVYTLDEWRAKQGPKAKPAFNVRKAGEGEKTNKNENLVTLNKKDDLDDSVEYIVVEKPSKKAVVPVQIRFNDGLGGTARGGGGGGRGGRGMGRGGHIGGGGGAVGGQPKSTQHTNSANFRVDDNSFPSLS